MTKEQIKKYEYCKTHLQRIKVFETDLKHNFQMYGCGQGQPIIEHTLDRIHREMHESIIKIYNDTTDKINLIINKI